MGAIEKKRYVLLRTRLARFDSPLARMEGVWARMILANRGVPDYCKITRIYRIVLYRSKEVWFIVRVPLFVTYSRTHKQKYADGQTYHI